MEPPTPALSAVGVIRYTGGPAWEPTLGITSDGTILFSSTELVEYPGVSLSVHRVRRSVDAGRTWQDVTPMAAEGVPFLPIVGDPYLFVDAETNRVFKSDNFGSQCPALSWSDDRGETWTNGALGCGNPPGAHDHQTLFAARPRTVTPQGYSNLVYYCVNRIADAACATSLNGGQTFGPLVSVYNGTQDPAGGGRCPGAGGQGSAGLDGKTDHGVAAPDGTAYLPRSFCGVPMVAKSVDDGRTWSQFEIGRTVPAFVGEHDVSLGVDEAGSLYAVWLGRTSASPSLFWARSTDAGLSWTEPARVLPLNVSRPAFWAVAAGGPGRVAISYMGSETPLSETDEGAITWNAYLTLLLEADGPEPVNLTVRATVPTNPIARGRCTAGCDGVGDFLDVQIDSIGRPWAAFVDVCAEACDSTVGASNQGQAAFVATLAQGPRLRGAPGLLPPLAGHP